MSAEEREEVAETVARAAPRGEFSAMRTVLGNSEKVGGGPWDAGTSVTVTDTVALSGERPCRAKTRL